MIDGVNIAISIEPDPITKVLNSNLPYQCASPGKSCSWKMSPSSPVLFQQAGFPVGSKPSSCTSNSDCTNGDICGLALLNAANQPKFGNICGPLQGYWSASQICSNAATQDSSPIAALHCYETPSGQSVTDLLGCTGTAPTSCYNTVATSNCCGCPTVSGGPYANIWPTLDPQQTNCESTQTNASWTKYVAPWLQFMKQACPTAYSFPFDDPTSTFTCTSNGSANETPGYTVTFSDLSQ